MLFRSHATVAKPGSSPGALTGSVNHREFLGATVRYALQMGQSEISVDASFQSGEQLFAPGDSVDVTLPQRAILWLSS